METEKLNIWQKILDNKKLKIGIIVFIILMVVVGCVFGCMTASKTINNQDVTVFIYPSDNFNEVKRQLQSKGVISPSNTSFLTFSKTLKYTDNIRAGRYVISPNTSILNLVRKLRSGNQQPLNLVILSARTTDEFCQKVCKNLLITPQELNKEIEKQGYNYSNELFEYIIPNTYEVYWTVRAEDFLKKLRKESDKFWENNKEKLKLSNLSKKDVIILASIVSEETNKKDEMSRIAGVYVNRLNKNMLLQADPTVKFANGDFSLQRITGKHLQTDSPFNTYKNLGLPPAPICLPNMNALMSVLTYEKHSYVYFCAKEDFSGYHNFATTYQEHLQNAIRYRKALNQRGIK